MLKKYLLLLALSSACAVGIDDVPADEQPTEQDMDASGDGSIEKQIGTEPDPTKTPTASDVSQLPYSVEIMWQAPVGWTASTMWLTAIWPRDVPHTPGQGAWYRNAGWTPPGLYKTNIRSIPYSCSIQQSPYPTGQFICRDYRGVTWYEQCPATITGAPEPRTWRSYYISGATQQGWFWFAPEGQARWKFWAERVSLTLYSLAVTGSGKQLNCSYGGPVTPYRAIDVWGMWK